MGMAASQGRLLFMTARISNNEFEQQCVAYSKQRLADDSQKANDQYLEALQATQYQILTGYNGDSPNYELVTYKQLTALNSVAARKQYVVSDNKGQIVVTEKIAQAFDENYLVKGNGHTNVDFNTFLKNVSDGKLTQVSQPTVTEADVHDAWDKYFASVNKGHEQGMYANSGSEHILGFSFVNSVDKSSGKNTIEYATYDTAYTKGKANQIIYLQQEIAQDGTTGYYYMNYPIEVESYKDENENTLYRGKFKPLDYYETTDSSGKIMLDNLMDNEGYVYIYDIDKDSVQYVDQNFEINEDGSLNYSITTDEKTTVKSDVTNQTKPIFYEGTSQEQRDLYDYAMAVSEKYAKGSELEYDADLVQYYRNIYQQMITKGFTTFKKMTDEGYINTMSYKGVNGETSTINSEKLAFNNDNWLVTLLKNGKLSIAFYDSNEKNFVKTTLDDDESIVEKENKSKMAIAEQVYQTHMDRIESEDKRFDMQLTKLESEHQALTTEYDSVAKVISKNVEKSFNIFNA